MMREIKDTVAEDCLTQLLVLVEMGEAIRNYPRWESGSPLGAGWKRRKFARRGR